MRIGDRGSARPIGSRRETGRPDGTSSAVFAAPTAAPGAARGVAVGSLLPLARLDSIVALQEVDDPGTRRRRAVRRGEAILDGLEELCRGLLDGALSRDGLDRLRASLARRQDEPDDPALRALLGQVELRAEVELAKLERDAAVPA